VYLLCISYFAYKEVLAVLHRQLECFKLIVDNSNESVLNFQAREGTSDTALQLILKDNLPEYLDILLSKKIPLKISISIGEVLVLKLKLILQGTIHCCTYHVQTGE
jgi:hypothetical protein